MCFFSYTYLVLFYGLVFSVCHNFVDCRNTVIVYSDNIYAFWIVSKVDRILAACCYDCSVDCI